MVDGYLEKVICVMWVLGVQQQNRGNLEMMVIQISEVIIIVEDRVEFDQLQRVIWRKSKLDFDRVRFEG